MLKKMLISSLVLLVIILFFIFLINITNNILEDHEEFKTILIIPKDVNNYKDEVLNIDHVVYVDDYECNNMNENIGICSVNVKVDYIKNVDKVLNELNNLEYKYSEVSEEFDNELYLVIIIPALVIFITFCVIPLVIFIKYIDKRYLK